MSEQKNCQISFSWISILIFFGTFWLNHYFFFLFCKYLVMTWERFSSRMLMTVSVCMCVYIYIYIHTHTSVCVYREREKKKHTQQIFMIKLQCLFTFFCFRFKFMSIKLILPTPNKFLNCLLYKLTNLVLFIMGLANTFILKSLI